MLYVVNVTVAIISLLTKRLAQGWVFWIGPLTTHRSTDIIGIEIFYWIKANHDAYSTKGMHDESRALQLSSWVCGLRCQI